MTGIVILSAALFAIYAVRVVRDAVELLAPMVRTDRGDQW